MSLTDATLQAVLAGRAQHAAGQLRALLLIEPDDEAAKTAFERL